MKVLPLFTTVEARACFLVTYFETVLLLLNIRKNQSHYFSFKPKRFCALILQIVRFKDLPGSTTCPELEIAIEPPRASPTTAYGWTIQQALDLAHSAFMWIVKYEQQNQGYAPSTNPRSNPRSKEMATVVLNQIKQTLETELTAYRQMCEDIVAKLEVIIDENDSNAAETDNNFDKVVIFDILVTFVMAAKAELYASTQVLSEIGVSAYEGHWVNVTLETYLSLLKTLYSRDTLRPVNERMIEVKKMMDLHHELVQLSNRIGENKDHKVVLAFSTDVRAMSTDLRWIYGSVVP
jgi:hypothetical protein